MKTVTCLDQFSKTIDHYTHQKIHLVISASVCALALSPFKPNDDGIEQILLDIKNYC